MGLGINKEFIRNHKVEVLALMALCIAYGFHGTVFNAIPYMFFRPDIMCKSTTDPNATEFVCSEEVMCDIQRGVNPDNLSFRMDSYNNINSIVIEYNLFCELHYYEALIQTVLTLGQLGGFLLSFIWNIPPAKKYKVILVTLYVEAGIMLMLNFFDSMSVVVFVLFSQNFLFSYFYAIIFVFFSDYFEKEITEIAPIITNFLWATTMIVYVVCAYYMTNWRNHLSTFSAIPILLLTIVFQYSMRNVKPVYLNQQTHPTIHAETESVLTGLKKRIVEIKNDPQQRKNLIAFITCNMCGSVSFFGVYIALNRLEGNIYVNNSVSILFELQGGIAAALLISRYPMKNILFAIFSVMSFAYLSCFFFQTIGSDDSKSVLSLIISLSPIFAAKAAHEMLFPIFVLYLPKIISKQYIQFAFAAANIIGVIMINFLPFYQYMMEELGLNQFVGYGVFMILAVVQLKNVVEIDQEEVKRQASRKPSSHHHYSQRVSGNSNEDSIFNGIELPLITSNFHH